MVIKQRQRELAPAGVALGEVAWCALAESFGVAAHRAETVEMLETALAEAVQADRPSLIEARVDPSSYADVLRAIRG
jgi:acetolactate synthase I/II/III large subunit